MRKLFALLIIIGYCFVSCSSVKPHLLYTHHESSLLPTKLTIPIYIDKEFSDGDKTALDNSINQWNYTLNHQIVLNVVDYNFDMQPELIRRVKHEGGFLFLKIYENNPTIPDEMPIEQCRYTKGCMMTLAWTDRIGGNVMKVVRERINSAYDLEHIVLHEIGHLLYLSHVVANDEHKDFLMYPHFTHDKYVCIDYDAASKVAQKYRLDIDNMNYCTGKY